MELFSEIKNRYFQLVFRLINECSDGKLKSDILKIIDQGEFEQKVIGKNQSSFADIILNLCEGEENLNLLIEEEGAYYPSMRNSSAKPPLPVRFTLIEKFWVKSLLEDDEIGLILSDETISKLQAELEGLGSPIKAEYFELTNKMSLPEIKNKEVYKKNFMIILDALKQEKPIRYNNTDRLGNIYTNKLAIPVGIEHSMRDGRFRFSMYSIDDNRPIMANIYTLSDIKIVEEDTGIDREQAKILLYEQKYSEEPVILEVTDKKAAMERCFMCFSGMERTSRDLGENKYEIRLNYYLFEEENLIRNIISLGPYVKVISPQRIADEVIRRVQKAVEQYNV